MRDKDKEFKVAISSHDHCMIVNVYGYHQLQECTMYPWKLPHCTHADRDDLYLHTENFLTFFPQLHMLDTYRKC